MKHTVKSLGTGRHGRVPYSAYLELDAIGSTHLSWLAVSPLYFQHMVHNPPGATPSQMLGSLVHSLVLDESTGPFVREPDPAAIAPDAKTPRATNAYKDAVQKLMADGGILVRGPEWGAAEGMRDAVLSHPQAAGFLKRATLREETLIVEWRGRFCRGRLDAANAKAGLLVDLKTTRDLARFSPYAVTDLGYYRQLAWYRRIWGLVTGEDLPVCVLIAVESDPPFDVGVFALDQSALFYGDLECKMLIEQLEQCEQTKNWPGMFPGVGTATVTNQLAERFAGIEER